MNGAIAEIGVAGVDEEEGTVGVAVEEATVETETSIVVVAEALIEEVRAIRDRLVDEILATEVPLDRLLPGKLIAMFLETVQELDDMTVLELLHQSLVRHLQPAQHPTLAPHLPAAAVVLHLDQEAHHEEDQGH